MCIRDRGGASCSSLNGTYNACNLDWSDVHLMGHSLGSSTALFMSKYHNVDHLAMLSGPYDIFATRPPPQVADVITEGGFATSSNDMFALAHNSESNAVVFLSAWNALGLSGSPVVVNSSSPPYGGSHQLHTDLTPGCWLDPNQKHLATAVNGCTNGSLIPAWLHMLEG